MHLHLLSCLLRIHKCLKSTIPPHSIVWCSISFAHVQLEKVRIELKEAQACIKEAHQKVQSMEEAVQEVEKKLRAREIEAEDAQAK